MSLSIYLLGQFRLCSDGQPLALKSRPAQSLLAYLALTAGMTHRREKLSGLLWPDATETNARSYLRQALWRIRKALEEGGVTAEDVLAIDDVSVTFNAAADYRLDVEALLQTAEPATVETLLESVDLYQGELLPGFYDEWVLAERDRIQAAYQQKVRLLLRELQRAARWHELVGASEEAIQMAHAPEWAYRALMQAYAGLHDQGMVRATYERCAAATERELDLEPSTETKQLYEALCERAGEVLPAVTADQALRQPAFLGQDNRDHVERPVFVAREAELARLGAFLDQAQEGRGQVVFITGEAGSGKTALLNEFAHQAQGDHPDLLVLQGSCNVHTGIGDPYLPFREVLEMLTGDVEGRWAAGAIDTDQARLLWHAMCRAAEVVVRDGPDLVNTFVHGPALLERISAAGARDEAWVLRLRDLAAGRGGTAVAVSMQQSDLFEQYARVLREIARGQALVIIIDDMQWADLASISLLFHLGRQLGRARILILGAYRPEEIALGRDGRRHPLEPVVNELQRQFGNNALDLNEAQSRDFVDSILDSESNLLGPSFRHLIFQQTRGNPLFTVELLRGMQERGDLVQNVAGQWTEGVALDWETLPARVEAVVAERIGRLAPPLQAALRTASVEGEVFTTEVVAGVSGVDEGQLLVQMGSELDRTHRLVKAQSIERRGDKLLSRYRFRHNVFQRFLYNSLNEVERVQLHEKVGLTLEEMAGREKDLATIAPQLARHFQEAQITEKAIAYLDLAARNAAMLSAYSEALALANRGISLIATLPHTKERDRQELSLQLSLAIAYQGAEGAQSTNVHEAWARARDLSRQTGEVLRHSGILGELSVFHYVRGELEQALGLGERALRVAEEAGDPFQMGMGHWYTGLPLFAMGEIGRAKDHFAQMVAIYDPEVHHQRSVAVRGSDAGLSCMAYESCCLWILGHENEARRKSAEAIELARRFNHAFTLADVLCYGGCLYHLMKRDAQAQLAYAIEFSEYVEEFGPGVWFGEAQCFRGDALARLGRVDEGIALLETGLKSRLLSFSNLLVTVSLCSLANAYLLQGRIEDSWTSLNRAIQQMEESSERFWRVEILLMKAELLRHEEQDEEATLVLQDALETARSWGAMAWEQRVKKELAISGARHL